MSGEARRPGLPAEPRGVGRGRGRAWGGEAPADRADAGRKLASKFYQLSSEEVGAGLGLRAPSAAAPKAAAAPCPGVTLSTPLPPCLGRLPAANWWGKGSGVKVKESRSRLVHSPSHTPWRHGAAGPHLILRPSEASTGLLTGCKEEGKQRHRTGSRRHVPRSAKGRVFRDQGWVCAHLTPSGHPTTQPGHSGVWGVCRVPTG